MARIISYEGKLPKRIGDFVIYKLEEDLIIRAKSGFTTKALKTSPKYANCRKNASEFGALSSSCKGIRMALQACLPKVHNLEVVNGLTKKMRTLLAHDECNAKGTRNLATALTTIAAKTALVGYNFNPLSGITLDFTFEKRVVQLQNVPFETTENGYWIGYRTHVLTFDFATNTSVIDSATWHIDPDFKTPFSLAFAPENPQKGTTFYLLELQFFSTDGTAFISEAVGLKALVIVGVE